MIRFIGIFFVCGFCFVCTFPTNLLLRKSFLQIICKIVVPSNNKKDIHNDKITNNIVVIHAKRTKVERMTSQSFLWLVRCFMIMSYFNTPPANVCINERRKHFNDKYENKHNQTLNLKAIIFFFFEKKVNWLIYLNTKKNFFAHII